MGDQKRTDPRTQRQQVRRHVRLQRVHHVRPRCGHQLCPKRRSGTALFFVYLWCSASHSEIKLSKY